LPVLAWCHRASAVFGAIALSQVAAISLLLLASPADAQNLLESLFGGQRATPAPAAESPTAGRAITGSTTVTDPRTPERPAGPSLAYCVRQCDGRYFPIQNHAGATPADMCRLFCPASKTKLFTGSVIDQAVASDGVRYADSANAYLYRKRIVANCTCNGRDAFGLAAIDVRTDPTLRAGDMIATGNGLRPAVRRQ
jgi:CubicO group peptidase (beta-lactamase class C family)